MKAAPKLIGASILACSLVTLWLFVRHQPPNDVTRCHSSRGCDIDFSAKVREVQSQFQAEFGGDRTLKMASTSANGLRSKDLAEIESVYKNEIEKMEEQIETLRRALDTPISQEGNKLERNNCSSLLVNDGIVRNCITGSKIGRVPRGIELKPFQTFHGGSPENSTQRKRSFNKVFQDRAWGHDWDPGHKGLNASGMGATLPWTQEMIATLNLVISDIKRDLGIARVKVLDVPCGDMAWMSRFLKTRNDIDYTGMDIVPAVIDNHRKVFQYHPWKFEVRDIVTNPINESYHLILCRTLLQHLYYHDAMSVLKQFSDSGSGFLLVTTWGRVKENEELQLDAGNAGRMRKLNLELPPVSLPPPRCLQRDGPPDVFEGWDHFIGLWKLPLYQVQGCQHANGLLPNTQIDLYSCVDWLLPG